MRSALFRQAAESKARAALEARLPNEDGLVKEEINLALEMI